MLLHSDLEIIIVNKPQPLSTNLTIRGLIILDWCYLFKPQRFLEDSIGPERRVIKSHMIFSNRKVGNKEVCCSRNRCIQNILPFSLVFRVKTSVMPRPKRNADKKCSKFDDGQSAMHKMSIPPPLPKLLDLSVKDLFCEEKYKTLTASSFETGL